jgi:hypothetical protein
VATGYALSFGARFQWRVNMETGVEAMKGEYNTLSVLFNTSKSLFRNILPITPLNSKIFREIPAKSMIPLDRGGGGVALHKKAI